jgi:hypothetical protein
MEVPNKNTLWDFFRLRDAGNPSAMLRVAGFSTVVLGLAIIHLFVQFRGLANATAMDQAQIARQLAMGNGFSTSLTSVRSRFGNLKPRENKFPLRISRISSSPRSSR